MSIKEKTWNKTGSAVQVQPKEKQKIISKELVRGNSYMLYAGRPSWSAGKKLRKDTIFSIFCDPRDAQWCILSVWSYKVDGFTINISLADYR